ncbi:hypothetical protein ACLMAL_37540 [Nocardia sp. CWNU-33]|uniref:hypothetical protein n=1 Tax=Nocardia sp. CWNU-33 TaxID=3392117 RepID=UPI00398F3A06
MHVRIPLAFTPGYLSMVERGRRPVTDAVISAYRTMLTDPTLGLSDVDVDRLAASTSHPDGAGTSSLIDVSVILERTRHLEDTVGATLVVPVIRGIDGVARALASKRAGGAAAAAIARGHSLSRMARTRDSPPGPGGQGSRRRCGSRRHRW